MIGKTLLMAGGMLAAGVCAAQQFPERAVRIVLPYGAGSSSDAGIRAFAHGMEVKLVQSVIVENRPGAGAMIGSTYVVRAPADGYTLLWTFPSAISRIFVKEPPFDVQKDLTPVSGFCTTGYVLAVNGEVPAKSLPEFVAYAKKNPGRLNYGQSASATFLAMEVIKSVTGIDLMEIQYKGTAEATTAVMTGEIQALVGLLNSFKPHEASGRLRILASSYAKRPPSAADIPTFTELGYPGATLTTTTAFLARSDVPVDRLAKLADAMSVDLPEVERTCASAGGGVAAQRGAALKKFVDDEMEQWRAAAVKAKFQPPQ